jgi:hypothetical protein
MIFTTNRHENGNECSSRNTAHVEYTPHNAQHNVRIHLTRVTLDGANLVPAYQVGEGVESINLRSGDSKHQEEGFH